MEESFPSCLVFNAKIGNLQCCSYETLRKAALEHLEGDTDGTQFIKPLLVRQHEAVLELILVFADLPSATNRGTMGDPKEPCLEAKILQDKLNSCLVEFLDGHRTRGLTRQAVSRRRRANMFLAMKLDVGQPYRFPEEWGQHSMEESVRHATARALADYLWPMVGGLKDPVFGSSADEQAAAECDASMQAFRRSLVDAVLEYPEEIWQDLDLAFD